MALRDKLVQRTQPYLEPGEQVQSVFMAQAGPSPYWMFLTYLMFFWFRPVIITVTDRSVLIINAGKLRTTFPKSLHLRGSRQVWLGTPTGLWGSIQLDDKYWVHKRFHKDVVAADAALQQMQPGGLPAPAQQLQLPRH
ncbi:hypothetical protein [Luteipulveratus mongoliensis]|uniref:YokE-like PH domain-containing protein n=1 Tax=Luteipulveratus mongoliensis TaxID=571913 RepID=A0A0K1JM51_9MICO|nr:hypothetical protein [Luteipulveratus mongoliensis]AKU17786.1 hypothetical protein VV02_21230 [Luteipulveratus mongoliensis]